MSYEKLTSSLSNDYNLNKEHSDKKSDCSHFIEYPFEKKFNFLLNENKELKENNYKLIEKKEEMEKKLKSLNIKLEEDEKFKIREIIYNKETKIEELKEKVRNLEKDFSISNGKLGILEGVVNSDLKIEDVFRTLNEKEILKYFNDMVTKNVDKKDELKRQNKVLLEKLILLGKEYNKINISINK